MPRPEPAPYPAPYEEPWGRLGEDLLAVAASTGLKIRELWRRNREGDLSVPGFWPQSLAAVFWPLLLALGLAAVLALLLSLARLRPAGQVQGSQTGQQTVKQGVQQTVKPVLQGVSQADQQPLGPPRRQPLVQSLVQPVEPQPLPLASQQPGPGQRNQAAPTPVLEVDPLLALLAEDDPDGCIAAVRPHPELSRLDLQLRDGCQARPREERQRQADHWLQRSRELGYEQLRLLAAGGAPIAQAARVGSGMVLLDGWPEPEA